MPWKVGVESHLVSRTSSRTTTFGLSAIYVFVFADAEKQRVRAALPDCEGLYLDEEPSQDGQEAGFWQCQ